MPRTANRKVTYTLEVDNPQLVALGSTTYFQTSNPTQALSNMGDAAVVVVGNIPELWHNNMMLAKIAIKQAFQNFITSGNPPDLSTMYSVNQDTSDFSSWDVKVNLRFIP